MGGYMRQRRANPADVVQEEEEGEHADNEEEVEGNEE